MNKGAALLLAIAVALAGCSPHAASEAPLAGAAIGGRFVLTDQDGHAFDSRRLAGRYPVVYFGYTFCPDVCPLDMAVLGKGLARFEQSDPARAAKVQPLFITVDPARDTPAVLKQFTANFSPRLIGLTGTPDQIAAVAKAYVAPFSKEPPAKGASGYLMQHSRAAILFGPDAKPIALVPVDGTPEEVARSFDSWVR